MTIFLFHSGSFLVDYSYSDLSLQKVQTKMSSNMDFVEGIRLSLNHHVGYLRGRGGGRVMCVCAFTGHKL